MKGNRIRKMFTQISSVLLTALLSMLLFAAPTSHAAAVPGLEQVVAEFQKLPNHLCFA